MNELRKVTVYLDDVVIMTNDLTSNKSVITLELIQDISILHGQNSTQLIMEIVSQLYPKHWRLFV